MSLDLWHWIVLASAAAFAVKLAGYAVPARWLQSPKMAQVAASMTVALLAALTVMNTFAAGTVLVVVLGAASAGISRWLVQG